MASKKELREQLGTATREREAALAQVRTHEQRETARMRREHDAEQQRRREAEHRARRENLDRLGEGLLSLKKRTRWAVVNEEGETGIEVFVPLDQEEQRTVLGFLNAKPQIKGVPISTAFLDEIRVHPNDYWFGPFGPRTPSIFDGIRFV